MTECNFKPIEFSSLARRKVVADFAGGAINFYISSGLGIFSLDNTWSPAFGFFCAHGCDLMQQMCSQV